MTDLELKEAKTHLIALNKKLNGEDATIYASNDKGIAFLKKELSCIEMINSILAYNNFYERGLTAEDVVEEQESRKYNYLKDYINEFGRDRVVELVQNQMNDIDVVEKCVFTDNEGVMYNSIKWIR